MASRDGFRTLAEENQEIFDLGLYEASDGTIVDIAHDMTAMMAGTHVVDAPMAMAERRTAVSRWLSLAAETTLAGVERVFAKGASSICVLNFASARSPGGGYLRGGNAQEEALCRATTLYPALAAQVAFYAANKAWPNAIYSDALIYSPSVRLIRDDRGSLRPDPLPLSVISAPAPNISALADQGLADRLQGDVARSLARRVQRILAVAHAQDHDALVLGAWGCGVFGNAPQDVAGLFARALCGPFNGCFRHVHFAVPGQGDDPNLIAFRDQFGPVLPG